MLVSDTRLVLPARQNETRQNADRPPSCPVLSRVIKQVGTRPAGRRDMRPSRIITEKYQKHEAFLLVKCIRRYV